MPAQAPAATPSGAAGAPPAAAGTLPELPAQPEIAGGGRAKPGWRFQRQAVAAAHPLAADAGAQVLRDGGSAVDAAVAVQMVLALVEPQSSGLGGGAFLMLWDGQSVQAWDGRETAPAAADERLFLRADGQPMRPAQAMVGGRAVGVPGVLRLLEAVHQRQGQLPWARLLAPAIALAETGFPMGERLHTQLLAERALRSDPQAGPYFYRPDGQPHPVGQRLRNPALAALLRRIAAEGSSAFYTGPAAADMVRRVQGHATNPGRLALADLAGYRPLQRAALCTDWAPHWRVCGMPPPSSGHLALMQTLGVLALLPQAAPVRPPAGEAPGADWLHAYSEAARLAYADRPSTWPTPISWPLPPGVGTACWRRTTCASARPWWARAAWARPRPASRLAPPAPGRHRPRSPSTAPATSAWWIPGAWPWR